jgi:hypothetical protein
MNGSNGIVNLKLSSVDIKMMKNIKKTLLLFFVMTKRRSNFYQTKKADAIFLNNAM